MSITGAVLTLARVVAIAAVLLIVYVKAFEHRLIYFPRPDILMTPARDYEEILFEAADGTRLHGWWLPADSPKVMLVSHGNGGNIGHRAVLGESLAVGFGLNVFLYDYRGYGRSEGRPSEDGLYADVRGAYTWVRSRGHAPADIILLGQSLGAAVAVDLAAAVPTGGVILEAPFTNIPDMARRLVGVPLGWLIRSRYDSASKIHRVDAPVAIIHARSDPVVPFVLGRRLFDAASEPKRFFGVEGEAHEGVIFDLGPEDVAELARFMGFH